MEIWKDIKGYEGFYQVSNLGNIKSLQRFIKRQSGFEVFVRQRILKPGKSKKGYWLVVLRNSGKDGTQKVHRLVAQHFIENPKNFDQVNHKDGIKTNNHVDNLEWCDNSLNQIHSYRVLGKKGHMAGKHGKNNPNSKKVAQIKNGVTLKIFDSSVEAFKQTGIHRSNICKVCRDNRYNDVSTAGGFHWRYI